MRMTRISVTAGEKWGHPTEQYANQNARVMLEAELGMGEDPQKSLKRLQMIADRLLGDEKRVRVANANAEAQMRTVEYQMRLTCCDIAQTLAGLRMLQAIENKNERVRAAICDMKEDLHRHDESANEMAATYAGLCKQLNQPTPANMVQTMVDGSSVGEMLACRECGRLTIGHWDYGHSWPEKTLCRNCYNAPQKEQERQEEVAALPYQVERAAGVPCNNTECVCHSSPDDGYPLNCLAPGSIVAECENYVPCPELTIDYDALPYQDERKDGVPCAEDIDCNCSIDRCTTCTSYEPETPLMPDEPCQNAECDERDADAPGGCAAGSAAVCVNYTGADGKPRFSVPAGETEPDDEPDDDDAAAEMAVV